MKLSTLLAALMLAGAMALAACGGDDDDDGDNAGGGTEQETSPAALEIVASDRSVEVTGDMTPGVTDITLRNDGKAPAAAQLIRVEGEHSQEELLRVYKETGEGGKIPDWFRAEGGISTAAPGQTAVVTQELPEGRYYAVNDEDTDKLGAERMAAFEISGAANAAELPSAATVTGSEYKFETEGPLQAGEAIAFENTGAQPHHLIAFRLRPGTTLEEARGFFSEENSSGPPPVVGEPSGTSVIDGERTIVADLGLKPGNYAFVCFIQDREGGPPHVAKGMISEATVE